MKLRAKKVLGIVVVLSLVFGVGSFSLAEEKGLVGYWKFDEGKGKIVKDSSGRGNDGKVHGAKWVKCESGYALEFDGKDDYVDCGNDKSLDLTSAITIEAWVRVNSSSWQGIVCKWAGTKEKAYALSTEWIGRGQAQFFLSYDGTNYHYLKGTTVIENGKWHHLAGTYDGNWMRIYVDGIEESSKEESFTISISRGNLFIGRWDLISHPFNGSIDEVRIYNRALSAEEIKNNCKKGVHYDETLLANNDIFPVGNKESTLSSQQGGLYQNHICRRQVLINQAGYLPNSSKYCVVEDNTQTIAETFSVWKADLYKGGAPFTAKREDIVVYTGKLKKVKGDFGTYYVGDFSKVREIGNYIIEVKVKKLRNSRFTSFVFRIAPDVYDEALIKGIHYFALQRCGPSKTGHHAPCHLDDKILLKDGSFKNIAGGWHDATDFLKANATHYIGVQGLLEVAQLMPKLKKSLYEEIKWGNDYLLKLQDPSGYIYSGCPGDKNPGVECVKWTDNIPGTDDDRILTKTIPNSWTPFDDHNFIIAECLLVEIYRDKHKSYTDKCLEAAKHCFEWVSQTKHFKDWWWICSGSGIGAGLQLYKVTGEEKYKEYALKMAEKFLSLQETEYIDNQKEVSGFFYESNAREWGTNNSPWNHVVYIYLCDLLEAFPDDKDAIRWRKAIELYCEDCLLVFAKRNAWGIVPQRVRMTSKLDPKEKNWYEGFLRGSRSIGKLRFRYFDKPTGGTSRVPGRLALTGIMFCKAAKLLNRPEWFSLAQRQLDFALGLNPFNLSFMNEIGYNNTTEYVYPYTQPRVPYIPGAVLSGVCGDVQDRPYLKPGSWQSAEYYHLNQIPVIWLIAELKAREKMIKDTVIQSNK